MTPPPTYRAHSVSDLLNVIPTLFGFVPRDSFVGICLQGDRLRFGFRLRIDLPEPANIAGVADVVAGHLDRGEGDRVILVGLGSCTDSARGMVQAVRDALRLKAVEVAVWADDERWWSDDNDAGTPWRQDMFHESIVKAISHGQVIRPDRSCIEQEFKLGERAVSQSDLIDAQAEYELRRVRSGSSDVNAGVAHIAALMATISDSAELQDDALILVAIWLRNLLVRDHFWFAIDQRNAREGLSQWAHVASRLPGVWRAAPLSLASFCAWQAGDGVRALLAAEAALEAQPDYALAALMLRVVEEGLPPTSWTRMRSSIHADA
ncbi:MAG: DUF4192 domain-containing protein [Actinomycetales bacterium]|nr:DUF4192 domain-containing protein [Actinomycetales bacterium]